MFPSHRAPRVQCENLHVSDYRLTDETQENPLWCGQGSAADKKRYWLWPCEISCLPRLAGLIEI